MAAFIPKNDGDHLPPNNPEDSDQAHDHTYRVSVGPSRKRASYTPSLIRLVCREFLLFLAGVLAVAVVLGVPIALRVAQNMIPVAVSANDSVEDKKTYQW